MRYAKLLTLVGICGVCLTLAPYAHAQRVAVGVGIGVGPGYIGPAPVCPYGYYDYYPYACAPYGFYGPEWFSGGFFIGAGPWFHGFVGRRGFVGRPGFYARPGFRPFVGGRGPGFVARGPVGGGFRGGGSFHGGGGSRGGGSHGGGRR